MVRVPLLRQWNPHLGSSACHFYTLGEWELLKGQLHRLCDWEHARCPDAGLHTHLLIPCSSDRSHRSVMQLC